MSEPPRARLHPLPGSVVLLLLHPLLSMLVLLGLMALPTPSDWTTNPESHYLRLLVVTGLTWLLMLPACGYLGGWLAHVDAQKMGLLRPLRAAPILGGLLVGLLLILVPATLGRLLGGYLPVATDSWSQLAVPTGFAALKVLPLVLAVTGIAALGEELLCRGLLLRYWQPRLGTWGAILVSSLLFTAMHAANQQLSAWGLLGLFLAGLLLALVFVESGDLLLVTGLHAGWNLSTAAVLGLPVSGFELPALTRWQVADSAVATRLLGGGFGPEEGLVYIAILVVLTAAMLLRGSPKAG